MALFGSLLKSTQSQQEAAERQYAETYKAFMQWEAKIGGELFGPIPAGTRREFFCLDENTWVWHEEWTDQTGFHALTTRYDIRANGILKSQAANDYHELSYEEATNLYNAITLYTQRVLPELDRWRNPRIA